MRSAEVIAAELAAARRRYAHTGPTHASVEACERLYDELNRAGYTLTGGGQMVKVKGASPKTKTVSKVAPKAKVRSKAKIEAKAAEKLEAGDPVALNEKGEAVKAAPKSAQPKPPKGPSPAEIEAADVAASVGRHPGGMEPPLTEDEARIKLEAEFAEADARGDPRWNEIQAGLAVRGF